MVAQLGQEILHHGVMIEGGGPAPLGPGSGVINGVLLGEEAGHHGVGIEIDAGAGQDRPYRLGQLPGVGHRLEPAQVVVDGADVVPGASANSTMARPASLKYTMGKTTSGPTHTVNGWPRPELRGSNW